MKTNKQLMKGESMKAEYDTLGAMTNKNPVTLYLVDQYMKVQDGKQLRAFNMRKAKLLKNASLQTQINIDQQIQLISRIKKSIKIK